MAYTAIISASGYSGQETLDRVLSHPELELVALGSDSLAGKPADALDPRLQRIGTELPAFVTNDEALSSGAELIFICLDYERAAALDPPATGVIVDLSGGHRLQDAAQYDRWYGFTHPKPSGLADWTYAIPELAPPDGRLIANPGCYATAAVLAVGPLVGASPGPDARSGPRPMPRTCSRTSRHTGSEHISTRPRSSSHLASPSASFRISCRFGVGSSRPAMHGQ